MAAVSQSNIRTMVSPAFFDAIEAYVMQKMDSNDLFAKKVCNPAKNIEDCVTYIINTIEQSGFKGFCDDEVYSMAVHYYEEENIEVGKLVNCQVVVNHQVELTPEEIAEMRQKAKDEVFRQEQKRLKNHNSVRRTVKPATTPQLEEETLTLF